MNFHYFDILLENGFTLTIFHTPSPTSAFQKRRQKSTYGLFLWTPPLVKLLSSFAPVISGAPQGKTFILNFKSRISTWHEDCNNSYFINNFIPRKWYEQVGHILNDLIKKFINATPPYRRVSWSCKYLINTQAVY